MSGSSSVGQLKSSEPVSRDKFVGQPLAVGIAGAQELTGLGRHTIMAGIKSKNLRAAVIGKENSKRPKYLIRIVDLDAWIQRLTENEE